ncbi:hypothetical protein [Rossellomorea marisflavi]|uniref:hypothetical protein n=1 Tax=Rossellomorea marisflavi TaxID=189381 RepID=UPI0015C4AA1C|nr:hypothetical protein [Rossellomorea marisflavi]
MNFISIALHDHTEQAKLLDPTLLFQLKKPFTRYLRRKNTPSALLPAGVAHRFQL